MLCKNHFFQVDDLLDKVRKSMEEADSPEGFQVFANSFDGFSAVTAGMIENINDEFAKPSIIFGVSPSHLDKDEKNEQDLFNTAMGLIALSKASTIYVPVVMDWPYYNRRLQLQGNPFYSSSILAASLDTATLPFRAFSRTVDFAGSLNLLRPTGSMNVCSLSTSFPFPVPPSVFTPVPVSVSEDQAPSDATPNFLHPLLPSFIAEDTLGELCSLRGTAPSTQLSDIQNKLAYIFHLPSRHASCGVIRQPLSVPKTFPLLLPHASASVVTRLQSSKGVYPYLHEIEQNFTLFKNTKYSRFFEDLEYHEVYEDLYNKAEGYAPMHDND